MAGRNLFLDGLQNQVRIVAVALSDGLGMNQMRMTSTDWGGAVQFRTGFRMGRQIDRPNPGFPNLRNQHGRDGQPSALYTARLY